MKKRTRQYFNCGAYVVACALALVLLSHGAEGRRYAINTKGQEIALPPAEFAQPMPGWRFKTQKSTGREDRSWAYAPNGELYNLNTDAVGNDKLIGVIKDGRFGYADAQGKMVLPPIYDEAAAFKNGFAVVKRYNEARYKVIDESGKTVGVIPENVFPKIFKRQDSWGGVAGDHLLQVETFDRGSNGYNDGIYNFKTNTIQILADRSQIESFCDGMAQVKIPEYSRPNHTSYNFKCGFINTAAKFVYPPICDDAGQYAEGLAPIKEDKRWFYIDKEGTKKITLPENYVMACNFSEGLAAVLIKPADPSELNDAGTAKRWVYNQGQIEARKRRWGFIDKKGKLVIQPAFRATDFRCKPSFSSGLCPLIMGDQASKMWGYIDRSGSFVIHPQFRLAMPFKGAAAIVEDDSPVPIAF